MKKVFSLATLFLTIGIMGASAQVTIGSAADPHEGAILDLSKSGKQLGLKLPPVYLKNLTEWQLEGEPLNVEGMVVYNTKI